MRISVTQRNKQDTLPNICYCLLCLTPIHPRDLIARLGIACQHLPQLEVSCAAVAE